jgi:hypothetical protein
MTPSVQDFLHYQRHSQVNDCHKSELSGPAQDVQHTKDTSEQQNKPGVTETKLRSQSQKGRSLEGVHGQRSDRLLVEGEGGHGLPRRKVPQLHRGVVGPRDDLGVLHPEAGYENPDDDV